MMVLPWVANRNAGASAVVPPNQIITSRQRRLTFGGMRKRHARRTNRRRRVRLHGCAKRHRNGSPLTKKTNVINRKCSKRVIKMLKQLQNVLRRQLITRTNEDTL